jgi:cbb3-type cytochrome oxidase maturation protein
MDILFLLIPLSVLLVFALMAAFLWALQTRQFEDLDREGTRILSNDDADLDADQGLPGGPPRHSPSP